MSAQRSPMHALAVLHIFAMAGLVVWWSHYFWQHTPARELLQRHRRAPIAHRRYTTGALSDGAAGELGRHAQDVAEALALTVPDVLCGLLVLSLFSVATGIYVRRFEVWLRARGSGETMTFAGKGLDDKALAANKARESQR